MAAVILKHSGLCLSAQVLLGLGVFFLPNYGRWGNVLSTQLKMATLSNRN